MLRTNKYLIILLLFCGNSFASYSYGELFVIEASTYDRSGTKVYLTTNTDNNLLNSYGVRIDQRVIKKDLSTLWLSLNARDSKLTNAAKALKNKSDITQTVNRPEQTLTLKYQLEFMRSSTTILNEKFNTILGHIQLAYGKTKYHKSNSFKSDTVDTISLSTDFEIPLKNFNLLINYTRHFDNFSGDKRFNHNEFAIGMGFRW